MQTQFEEQNEKFLKLKNEINQNMFQEKQAARDETDEALKKFE